MAEPSSLIQYRSVALAPDRLKRSEPRTRVLAVGVDAGLIPSLLPWLPPSVLYVEGASDFLCAVERLLGDQWDVVVAGVGDDVESDLRPWLEALEQARGRPQFIALVRQGSGAPGSYEGACTLAELEARHIRQVLKDTGGRIEAAARILGIHRNTLTRKLRGLGLQKVRSNGNGVGASIALM